MITVHPSDSRGRTQIDWLNSRHAFSFGDYYNRDKMGYGDLVVINEDHIAPGSGFGMHSHRNMEIITYVLEGELKHNDSLGTGSIIRPGEVQRMSAGDGIVHSEINPSPTAPVHLLQIWIRPDKDGIAPEYEQKEFPIQQERNKLLLVASKDGREGSLKFHQDASVYASALDASHEVTVNFASGRRAWIQVARGFVTVNGMKLGQGDAATVEEEVRVTIAATEKAEVLVFDLP